MFRRAIPSMSCRVPTEGLERRWDPTMYPGIALAQTQCSNQEEVFLSWYS